MSVTYTLAEAAKRLSCSADTVRNLIRAKRLHAVNLATGKTRAKWIVPESAIAALLAAPDPQNRPKRSRRQAAKKRY